LHRQSSETPTSRVLDYLDEKWTIREIKNFTDEVENVLSQIAEPSYIFEATRKSKHIRKGFFT
jgi:hypothetical protein